MIRIWVHVKQMSIKRKIGMIAGPPHLHVNFVHVEQSLWDGGHPKGVVVDVSDAPAVWTEDKVPHLHSRCHHDIVPQHSNPQDCMPLSCAK